MFTILSYTVSKLVRFLRHSVSVCLPGYLQNFRLAYVFNKNSACW